MLEQLPKSMKPAKAEKLGKKQQRKLDARRRRRSRAGATWSRAPPAGELMAAAKEGWDFSCPDWAERLKAGESLIPELPLDAKEAARAVAIFNRLRLPDVPGCPTLADPAATGCATWSGRCADRSTPTGCATSASSWRWCRRRTSRRPAARRSC
jgi:hypothetical protein